MKPIEVSAHHLLISFNFDNQPIEETIGMSRDMIKKIFLNKYIYPAAQSSGLSEIVDIQGNLDYNNNLNDIFIEVLGGLHIDFTNCVFSFRPSSISFISICDTPKDLWEIYRKFEVFAANVLHLLTGKEEQRCIEILKTYKHFTERLELAHKYFDALKSFDENVSLTLLKNTFFSFYLPKTNRLIGGVITNEPKSLYWPNDNFLWNFSNSQKNFEIDKIVELTLSKHSIDEIKQTLYAIELESIFELRTEQIKDADQSAITYLNEQNDVRMISSINDYIYLFQHPRGKLIFDTRTKSVFEVLDGFSAANDFLMDIPYTNF